MYDSMLIADFGELDLQGKEEFLQMYFAEIMRGCRFLGDNVVNPVIDEWDENYQLAYCRAAYIDSTAMTDYGYLYGNLKTTVKSSGGGEARQVSLNSPARVRDVSIVKPIARALMSQQRGLPILPFVHACDDKSIQRKMDNEARMIVSVMEDAATRKLMAYQVQGQMISMQEQLLAQAAQAAQQGDQQAAQEMKAQAMMASAELQRLNGIMNQRIGISSDDVRQAQAWLKKNYRDATESNVCDLLEYYIRNRRIRGILNMAFEEKCIHDKPIIFCDWQPGMDFVEARNVRPEDFRHHSSPSVTRLRDCEWTVERQTMSVATVIEWMRPDRQQLDKIKKYVTRQYGGNTYDNVMPNGQIGLRNINRRWDVMSANVEVYTGEFRMEECVYVLVGENKAGGNPFIKVLTADQGKRGMGIDRSRLKARGQKVVKRYRISRWQVKMVGQYGLGELYSVGKLEYQHRDPTQWGDVKGPYIGVSHNRFIRPYSIFWETRHLQELLNITYYQIELLIVLSGVKGIIYDISQMPKGFKLPEVLHYMKRGIMLIQSKDGNGKNQNSFNQFSTYDQGLSQSIMMLIATADRLEKQIKFVIGVTDAFMGQIKETDQVGTFRDSIGQSSANMAIYYQEHDDLQSEFLTRLANLGVECHKDGISGQFIIGPEQQRVLRIPKRGEEGGLDGYYQVAVEASEESGKKLNNIRMVAAKAWGDGRVKGSDYVRIQTVDNTSKLLTLLEEAEGKMEELAQMAQQAESQSRQQQANAEAQAKAQLLQLQGQIDQQAAQMKAQIESQATQINAQIDEQKIMQMAQAAKVSAEMDRYKADSAAMASKYKVDEETKIEREYLAKEEREVLLNNENAKLQMMLGDMQATLDRNASSKKEKVK